MMMLQTTTLNDLRHVNDDGIQSVDRKPSGISSGISVNDNSDGAKISTKTSNRHNKVCLFHFFICFLSLLSCFCFTVLNCVLTK